VRIEFDGQRLVLAGGVFLLLLAFWMYIFSGSSKPTSEGGQRESSKQELPPRTIGAVLVPAGAKQVTVPANVQWFDTGLDVNGTVRIDYLFGRWSATNDQGNVWSDGDLGQAWSGLLVPSGGLRAMVGMVNNLPFVVGKVYYGRPGNGRLFLSMNDVVGKYDDNMGAISVLVTTE
jgi:hypothetical protein